MAGAPQLLIGAALGACCGYLCACFFCSCCPSFDLTAEDLRYASRRREHAAKVASRAIEPASTLERRPRLADAPPGSTVPRRAITASSSAPPSLSRASAVSE